MAQAHCLDCSINNFMYKPQKLPYKKTYINIWAQNNKLLTSKARQFPRIRPQNSPEINHKQITNSLTISSKQTKLHQSLRSSYDEYWNQTNSNRTNLFKTVIYQQKTLNIISQDSKGYRKLFCSQSPTKPIRVQKQQKLAQILKSNKIEKRYTKPCSETRYTLKPTKEQFLRTRQMLLRQNSDILTFQRFKNKSYEIKKSRHKRSKTQIKPLSKCPSEQYKQKFLKIEKGKMYSRLLNENPNIRTSLSQKQKVLELKNSKIIQMYEQKNCNEQKTDNLIGPWNIENLQCIDVNLQSNF